MRDSVILGLIAWLTLAASATTINASPAPVPFTLQGSIPFNYPQVTPHGMAFDGTRWYVGHAASSFFGVYDSSFAFLQSVQASPFSDVRGLAYDATSDSLFIGDCLIPRIRQVTKAGALINQFELGVPNYLNAITYDGLTD